MKLKILFIIIATISFNNLFSPSMSITNNSSYNLTIFVGQEDGTTGESDLIEPTGTYYFDPRSCVTGIMWYTDEKVEKEIDLGFNIGKKKVTARLGGAADFKDKNKKCARTDWTISKNLELS